MSVPPILNWGWVWTVQFMNVVPSFRPASDCTDTLINDLPNLWSKWFDTRFLVFRGISHVPDVSLDSSRTTRIIGHPRRISVVRHAVGACAVRISADTPSSANSRITASNPPSVHTQSSVCSVVLPLASQKSNNIAVLETFVEYRNLKRELERALVIQILLVVKLKLYFFSCCCNGDGFGLNMTIRLGGVGTINR